MPEVFRTRDCTVLVKGDAYPVALAPGMLATGWMGGQAARWVDAPTDELMVDISDGTYGGFLLWGSDESSDQWTAMTGQEIKYGYGVLCSGGWVISISTYEKYTWASRQGPGPLVPLNYRVGERLVFSLRGYWTNEDEWTASGDPRAPNTYYIANVIQTPQSYNNYRIQVQTSI